MLTPERHERILQKLREYKTITVQELTVQLNLSGIHHPTGSKRLGCRRAAEKNPRGRHAAG